MSAAPAELAAGLIDAINTRDPAGLEPLLSDGSAVVTGRSTHAGPDAIAAWAAKEYDHLVRRYAIDEYRASPRAPGRVLALGSVQYVWADGGEVADSSPIAITIEFHDGLLRSMELHDDQATALAGFEG